MGLSYDPTVLLFGCIPRKINFLSYIYIYMYIYTHMDNRIHIRNELDVYKNVNSNIFIININGSNPHFHK